jgi:hypothetical protein
MFTTNNRRNRNAAIITIAAASFIVSSSGFAAPKRDVGRGRLRQDASFEVRLIHPSTPAAGSGDHDVTTGAMRNRDLNISPEPGTLGGTIVTITTPSPFPTGRGHDTTAAGLRKRDRKVTPQTDVFIVTLSEGSPLRSTHGHDFSAGALIASGDGSARTSGPASGRSFIQSLDLTSSVRYVGGSTVTAPARNPFADGRAWVSLDREGQSGLVATAGWSFLLK